MGGYPLWRERVYGRCDILGGLLGERVGASTRGELRDDILFEGVMGLSDLCLGIL